MNFLERLIKLHTEETLQISPLEQYVWLRKGFDMPEEDLIFQEDKTIKTERIYKKNYTIVKKQEHKVDNEEPEELEKVKQEDVLLKSTERMKLEHQLNNPAIPQRNEGVKSIIRSTEKATSNLELD